MKWILPIVMTLAIHLTWFHSNLPAHVFGILKKLRMRADWTKYGDETKFFDSWFTWVNVSLPEYWAELLTCPVCLSWHMSFYTSGLVTLIYSKGWEYFFVCGFTGIVLCYVQENVITRISEHG